MKKIFNIKCFSLSIFTLLIFVSCQKKDYSLSRNLLLEQSKDLILANQREINGLLSQIAEENLKEKKETSSAYEQISKLYDELENFNSNIKDVKRTQIEEIIKEQNIRFKNDNAFKIRHLEFKPVKIDELIELDDEVFKFYVASKVSRFYVHSAGNIFLSREHSHCLRL